MKLIIDIPDWHYRDVHEFKYPTLIDKAIRDGVPLPKGHGRLIDADACKKNKIDFCEESTRNNWYDIIDDLLDDAPTIIEADNGD